VGGPTRFPDKDPRLDLGNKELLLSPRNANTMWILHFLYHLKDTGAAGFVMAPGVVHGELHRCSGRGPLIIAEVLTGELGGHQSARAKSRMQTAVRVQPRQAIDA